MPEIADIQQKRIAVIGLGFVGLPLGATLADIGFRVTGIDASDAVRASLKKGKSHFEEQGLQMLLDRHLGKGFVVVDALQKGEHDVYFIAVGTPVDPKSRRPIMDYVKNASETVGKILKKGDLVIMRSTVPVSTTREIVLPSLEKESGLTAGKDFHLVFAPERLVAGRALQELRELPQIIGGLTNETDLSYATQLFKKMTPIVVDVDSIESAEMAKIIDNSYRDLTFAYANQMARLCECIGIDMVKLATAVNFGYKRNHVPAPSPGVGGTCLTKDPFILLQVGEKFGYEPKLARIAREINESMPGHVVEKVAKLLQEAGKDPKKNSVFVLGFAFKGKPETSDMRDSPTIPVVQGLQKLGCTVTGFDPVARKEQIEKLGVTVKGLEEGFRTADAAVIMTNHPTFERMDIVKLLSLMPKPAVFLDGWHLFDPKEIRTVSGIHYGGIGND
ncbi:nucleotide sugar dehydrogenase [Candidatus Peregrinibacteria bacterium]|nr:nucleotide sugar dehydrogenase [Candidatus Peregrinibacteria bacterium]